MWTMERNWMHVSRSVEYNVNDDRQSVIEIYGQHWILVAEKYTTRQLWGITLLVPPFCLTEGGNLCQRQYKALANIYNTSCDPLTIFSGRPSLLSCPSQPSFVGMLISPIGPKAAWLLPVDHIQLLAITVCKFPSQIEVAIMPINFRPVIFENIVWF